MIYHVLHAAPAVKYITRTNKAVQKVSMQTF